MEEEKLRLGIDRQEETYDQWLLKEEKFHRTQERLRPTLRIK